MVALALLVLQGPGAGHQPNQRTPRCWPCAWPTCGRRAAARAGQASRPPNAPASGPQWLPSIGLDLAAISHPATAAGRHHELHPLFGLPILMAAVLGTLTLALGTTAGVTLLLLGWAWWAGTHRALDLDDAPRYLQSALTGTGYFIVSYLVHQLATRLAREQEVAQQSQDCSPRADPGQCTGHPEPDRRRAGGGRKRCGAHVANPAGLQHCSGQQPAAARAAIAALASEAPWQPAGDPGSAHFSPGTAPDSRRQTCCTPAKAPPGLHVRTWLTSTREGTTEPRPSGCA